MKRRGPQTRCVSGVSLLVIFRTRSYFSFLLRNATSKVTTPKSLRKFLRVCGTSRSRKCIVFQVLLGIKLVHGGKRKQINLQSKIYFPS